MMKGKLGKKVDLFTFRKPFSSKKGVLFIIDVLLGFSIIVIGFLMLTNFYYDVPLATQSETYADDFIIFLTTTEYSEFQSHFTRTLMDANLVFEDESIGESLSRFCFNNDTILIESIINNSLDLIVPDPLNYRVNFYDVVDDKVPLVNCSVGDSILYRADSSRLSVGRSLIISQGSNYELVGPYILEVRVW